MIQQQQVQGRKKKKMTRLEKELMKKNLNKEPRQWNYEQTNVNLKDYPEFKQLVNNYQVNQPQNLFQMQQMQNQIRQQNQDVKGKMMNMNEVRSNPDNSEEGNRLVEENNLYWINMQQFTNLNPNNKTLKMKKAKSAVKRNDYEVRKDFLNKK